MNKKGFTLVELLVVIAIIGILAGALFPSIGAAINNARLTSAVNTGKKLHQAIMTANLESDQRSRAHIWPSTSVNSSSSSSNNSGVPDVRKTSYSNSTDYFWDAYAGETMTKPKEHYPLLQGAEITWLGATGVPAYSGTGKFEPENIAWTIAANVNDSTLPEFIPVLFTRNLDASGLVLKFDGGNSSRITLGKDDRTSTPFGDSGFALVRLGGAADKFLPVDATVDVIFNGQSFDITETKYNNNTLTYLTPWEISAPSTN